MLVLKTVTNMHLLTAYCPNKYLHIFGFYNQIEEETKVIDEELMKVFISAKCKNCDCVVIKTIDLMWDPTIFSNGAGI